MYLLLAFLEVKPDFYEKVEGILRSLTDLSSKETGNIVYAVHRPLEQQNCFVVYELYKDRSACDSHLQSEYVQNALNQFDTMLSAPPKITFCDTLYTTIDSEQIPKKEIH